MKRKAERVTDAPGRDKSWASREDCYSSLCLWHRLGCVSTLQHKDCTKRTEMMERWQHQEVQVKESRWAQESPQRWKQPKGEDRTEMNKEAKLLRCTLLNGPAWSTERTFLRKYKSTFDIFFGIEHRLRKEEMEEQFNKEAKEESCKRATKWQSNIWKILLKEEEWKEAP